MSQEDAQLQVRDVTAVMRMNERRLGSITEANKALVEVARAVRATGKAGSITIKFNLAMDKNDELAMTLDCEVSSKAPKQERKKALVYFDEGTNTFSKTDPRQLELLAEQAAEREERETALKEQGIAQIGRGPASATA